jgi:hypothetical protein
MAGQLTIDTLRAGSGVLSVANGMTGIAKAWVTWNGNSGASIFSSFNVSSITYNTTGDYTINFTTAMANANYAVSGTAAYGSSNNAHCVFLGNINGTGGSTRTTSACEIAVRYMNGANPPPTQDCPYIGVAFFSS